MLFIEEVMTLELDFFWLGLGIAAFGYSIGNGLKNLKNYDSPSLTPFVDDDFKLIKENESHWFIALSKEDAKKLVEAYPDVPHIEINGKRYYPREKLKQWLLEIEGKQS